MGWRDVYDRQQAQRNFPYSAEANKARRDFVREHWVEGVHYGIVAGVTIFTEVPFAASLAHIYLHEIYDNIFPVGSGGTNGTPASADPIFGFLNKRTAPASRRARSVSAHGGRRKGAKPRKRCPPGFRWNGRRCVSK